MNAAAQSTIAHFTPRPADLSIVRAVRDWEADICDAYRMADILNLVASDLLASRGDKTLSEQECERVLFCVYDLTARMGQIKQAYYAALAGE